MIRKIKGNYSDVLLKMGMPPSFLKIRLDAPETIQKDLPRGAFVAFDDKTFETLRATWESGTISKFYAQGDMNASVFTEMMYLISTQLDPNPLMLKKLEKLNPDMIMELFARRNLSFAYFDDNDVPCGFSITYNEVDHSIWTATVINNTTGEPENRVVTTLCSEVCDVDGSEDGYAADLYKALNSASITQLLSHIILDNDTVNIEELNALSRRIKTNQNIDDRNTRSGQFDELMAVATQSLPQATFKDILSRRNDLNFYNYEGFLKTIDEMNQILKDNASIVKDNASNDRLVNNMALISAAVKFELLASTYTEESQKYAKKGLLLQAKKLRLASADQDSLIKEVNFSELMQEASGPLVKEAMYLESLHDFDTRLSELLKLLPNNEYLRNAVSELERIVKMNESFLERDNIQEAIKLVTNLQNAQRNVSEFEKRLLASTKVSHLANISEEGSDQLKKFKEDLERAPTIIELKQIITIIMEEIEIFDSNVNAANFDARLIALSDTGNSFLQAIVAKTQEEIAGKTKSDSEFFNPEFFTSDDFRKISRAIDTVEKYTKNLDEFKKELEKPRDTDDINQQKLLIQSRLLLKDIADVVALEDIGDVVAGKPGALTKMSEILDCAKKALINPADKKNIEKLVESCEEASKKESIFWQKLGGGLWMFVGLVLMAAGVVLAPITMGASLLLTVFGAFEVGQGKAFFDTKEQGLRGAASNYKEALGQIKVGECLTAGSHLPTEQDDVVTDNSSQQKPKNK